MKTAISATAEALREVAFGSITNAYTAVGTATTAPVRMFRIVNATDKAMYISLDGTTNQFYLTGGSFVLYDLCANRVQHGTSFVLPEGTIFYVKYAAAPTSGSLAIETIVGRGE